MRILYHGTNQNFTEFSKDCLGSVTRSEASAHAFFFSARLDTATAYARLAERVMIPDEAEHETRVADLLRQAEAAAARRDFAAAERLGQEAEDLDFPAIRQPPAGGMILSVEVTLKNPACIDASKSHVIPLIPEFLEAALKRGNDGVIFRGLSDLPQGMGRPDDHVAVFDPANIQILGRMMLEPAEPIPVESEPWPSPFE